jgi:hypothetical protein
LSGSDGDLLVLRVTGYQFPDAKDLRQRYSWHNVEGEATCREGSWTFRFPALTCDESARVSSWLQRAADWCEAGPNRGEAVVMALAFTEPNLSLQAVERLLDSVVLAVGLDLEFQPPWHKRTGAGDPFVLRLRVTPDGLRRAASEWEAEIAKHPDEGYPYDLMTLWRRRRIDLLIAEILALGGPGDLRERYGLISGSLRAVRPDVDDELLSIRDQREAECRAGAWEVDRLLKEVRRGHEGA